MRLLGLPRPHQAARCVSTRLISLAISTGVAPMASSDRIISPFCNLRCKNPASTLASVLKGCVFTTPFNQTSGLLGVRAMIVYVQYDITEVGYAPPLRQTSVGLQWSHEH